MPVLGKDVSSGVMLKHPIGLKNPSESKILRMKEIFTTKGESAYMVLQRQGKRRADHNPGPTTATTTTTTTTTTTIKAFSTSPCRQSPRPREAGSCAPGTRSP